MRDFPVLHLRHKLKQWVVLMCLSPLSTLFQLS